MCDDFITRSSLPKLGQFSLAPSTTIDLIDVKHYRKYQARKGILRQKRKTRGKVFGENCSWTDDHAQGSPVDLNVTSNWKFIVPSAKLAVSLQTVHHSLRGYAMARNFHFSLLLLPQWHLSELYNLFLLIFHTQSGNLRRRKTSHLGVACFVFAHPSIRLRLIRCHQFLRFTSSFCCFRSSFVYCKTSAFYNNTKVSASRKGAGNFWNIAFVSLASFIMKYAFSSFEWKIEGAGREWYT